jgi:hypothetical protein
MKKRDELLLKMKIMGTRFEEDKDEKGLMKRMKI